MHFSASAFLKGYRVLQKSRQDLHDTSPDHASLARFYVALEHLYAILVAFVPERTEALAFCASGFWASVLGLAGKHYGAFFETEMTLT